MRPLKASLFIAYCLLAVALVGTAFSHVWRTSRLLAKDRIPALAQQTNTAPNTAAVPPVEPNLAQS